MAKTPQRRNYSSETMEKAMATIRKNKYSVRDAARVFNVPRSTLGRLLRQNLSKLPKLGAPTVLDEMLEDKIVECVKDLADAGFPITKNQMIGNVSGYISNAKIQTSFKNGSPGIKWFRLFRGRHRDISLRIAENISKSRAAITEERIRSWFDDVKRYLTDKGSFDAFDDPERIFNVDETAVFLSPEANRVIAPRGARIVYNITKNNDKECVTVLLGGNAAGIMCPPMILFKNKIFPRNVSKNLPSSWSIGNIHKEFN